MRSLYNTAVKRYINKISSNSAKMKVILPIILLLSAFAFVYSGSLARQESNSNTLLLHHKDVQQKHLKSEKHLIRFGHTLSETLHAVIQSKIAAKQDLNDILNQFFGIATQILSATRDYINRALERKYGIDDEATKTFQDLADIFNISVNLNKVSSYHINDSVRDSIEQGVKIYKHIFSYFLNRVLKENNINISNCKVPNSNVSAPDGWHPFFVVLKFFQGRFACIYSKRFEHDKTITDIERNIYRKFFDIVMKLYETDTLINEEDKDALKTSMKYFLQQVRKLNFSRAINNAVEDLTNIFVKVLCGEQLSLRDKYLAVKSSITISIAQLRGNNDIFSLINNRRTRLFMSSLYPIAFKIGLKEYVKYLRNNSDKPISPNSRSFLKNISPLVKGLFINILNYVRYATKKLPRYMIIQVITQHQSTEHKEEHPKTSIVYPYRAEHMSERNYNKGKHSKNKYANQKLIHLLLFNIRKFAGSKTGNTQSRDFE